MIAAAFLLGACSTTVQNPITAAIYPNLDQARNEGFHLLAASPPIAVDYRAEAQGGSGTLSYAWDFTGDGTLDTDAPDPEPFAYESPGEYTATLHVSDESGQQAVVEQRIVVIGEPDRPDWRFGVTDHLNWDDFYRNDAELERTAQLISEAGIEAVRLDLSWSSIQPQKDEYRWEDYDQLVSLSQRYGFDLLPIIAYSSEWASTGTGAPNSQDRLFAPPAPAEYAWFAYNAADRYKGAIPAWQVWNEPNLSNFWRPQPEPARYADLLRHAYFAIKYADPGAVVVMGGLTEAQNAYGLPQDFLQAVYSAGGRPFFDALGSHPYTEPSAGTERLVEKLETLRAVMAANGDSEKPIWITEYGTSTVPAAGVTDEAQGEWLTQSFDAISSYDDIPVVFWYNFRETGTDPNNRDHNFGLIENDWTIKPAYEEYKDYIANGS